jgi:hypothetical protein
MTKSSSFDPLPNHFVARLPLYFLLNCRSQCSGFEPLFAEGIEFFRLAAFFNCDARGVPQSSRVESMEDDVNSAVRMLHTQGHSVRP